MRFGVLQFPGSCDDRDALAACRRVGDARMVWHEESDLDGIDVVVVPGGFSYGDYLRAGAIARFAPAMQAVARHAERGGPVLGICNGFQVLCESGLLPGALLTNESLLFTCRQVELLVESSDSAFTRELRPNDRLSIPVKHQTGRYFAPADDLDRLEARDRAALRAGPQPEWVGAGHRRHRERGRQRRRSHAAPRARGRSAHRLRRRAATVRVGGRLCERR